MPRDIKHDTRGRVVGAPSLVREMAQCEHGVTGTCFWCNFNKKKLAKMTQSQRQNAVEDQLIALTEIVKMLLKAQLQQSGKRGVAFQTSAAGPVLTKLIDSGVDANKPTGSHQLAFWFSTDTDNIYQWRDSAWIDISFSRPTTPVKRVTDISYVPATDSIDVTHED